MIEIAFCVSLLFPSCNSLPAYSFQTECAKSSQDCATWKSYLPYPNHHPASRNAAQPAAITARVIRQIALELNFGHPKTCLVTTLSILNPSLKAVL